MTPWQIAKESESSQQIALFCWAAKAQKIGFKLAMQKAAYDSGNAEMLKLAGVVYTVPELKFLHHIPNGGSRGDTAKSADIAGGRLKAEGVKAGVLDIFWPLCRTMTKHHSYEVGGDTDMTDLEYVESEEIKYCGLYIEMKKPSLKNEKNILAGCSEEQLEFGKFVTAQHYNAKVCYSWLEAAKVLEDYYNLGK